MGLIKSGLTERELGKLEFGYDYGDARTADPCPGRQAGAGASTIPARPEAKGLGLD